MEFRRRWFSWIGLAMAAAGCTNSVAVQAEGDPPFSVVFRVVQSKLGNPNVTISAEIRNPGPGALVVRVRCTAIAVDQRQNGGWIRYEDLRLCAPPDRVFLPEGSTLTTADQRELPPGTYRAVVEAFSGKTGYSEPFEVAAIR